MNEIPRDIVDNRNLFSNYFLENILPTLPEWSDEAHRAALEDIRRKYATERRFLPDLNEAQLEERFFRPLLRILGFTTEVQEGIHEALDFPDYALFESRGELDRAHLGTHQLYDRALGIAEVKRWDTKLDRFGRDRHNKQKNPSYQIWHYLRLTKPRWGILSNGRKWRLYHQDRPMDSYFEVDLARILEEGDDDSFRYFYYFFRKEAFVPKRELEPFLERVLHESEDYAREVGENLKQNVYQALRILAQGFFDLAANNLDITNEDHIALVHKSVMRLLYRLLFVLFGEGKGLIGGSDYLDSPYSLYRLKHEVAQKRDRGDFILPSARGYWSRLIELFNLLDKGSVALGIPEAEFYVPAYNGGLFDPRINDFLETKVVGDLYIAKAVDLLTRAPTNGGPLGFVDYSTLDIRHLGSIYEGLLEYRIRVAPERMVAIGGRLVWTPYEEYEIGHAKVKSFEAFPRDDRAEPGELILLTDRGERHATGSYYTPDYIVDYIVETTLEPVVKRKWQDARDANEPLSDATLAIKVLDPAMGSGHFLVGAVEFLARKLLEALGADVEENYIPEEEAARWTPDLAKRVVTSHCIYGVDLNELAVELAKVSLWLTTVSRDRPLSFLDHHLKWGDSLIGSRIIDLGWLPGERPEGAPGPIQLPFGHVEKILTRIRELDEIEEETVDDIKRKEDLFLRLRESDEYRRIRLLADVHAGLSFGNFDLAQLRKGYMELAAEAYFGDPRKWERKFGVPWAREALEEGRGRRSFHWELEFPEVFFRGETAERETSRFDAIIGNPPYERVQVLNKKDPFYKPYLDSSAFHSTTGNYDLAVVFLEKGFDLLSGKGELGYIVTNKFIEANYGEGIRRIISDSDSLRELVHFGHEQVFEGEASTYTCLLFLSKVPQETFRFAQIWRLDDPKARLSALRTLEQVEDSKMTIGVLETKALSADPWVLVVGTDRALTEELLALKPTLGAISDRISQGFLTSADSIYIVKQVEVTGSVTRVYSKALDDEVELESDVLRPLVKGKEIKRYVIDYSGRLVIFPFLERSGRFELIPVNTMADHYPKLHSYLKHFESELRGREGGKWDNDQKWHSFSRPQNLDLFPLEKVITPFNSFTASFALDEGGIYFTAGVAGGYGIRLKEGVQLNMVYLLGVLNSSLVGDFLLRKISTPLRGGYYSYEKRFIERLPIKIPSAIESGDVAQMIESAAAEASRLSASRNRLLSLWDKASRRLKNNDLRLLDILKDDAANVRSGNFEKTWTARVSFYPGGDEQSAIRRFERLQVRSGSQKHLIQIYGIDQENQEEMIYEMNFRTRDHMLLIYFPILSGLGSRSRSKTLKDLWDKTSVPVIEPEAVMRSPHILEGLRRDLKTEGITGVEEADIARINENLIDFEAQIDAGVFSLYGLSRAQANSVLESLSKPASYRGKVLSIFSAMQT